MGRHHVVKVVPVRSHLCAYSRQTDLRVQLDKGRNLLHRNPAIETDFVDRKPTHFLIYDPVIAQSLSATNKILLRLQQL